MQRLSAELNLQLLELSSISDLRTLLALAATSRPFWMLYIRYQHQLLRSFALNFIAPEARAPVYTMSLLPTLDFDYMKKIRILGENDCGQCHVDDGTNLERTRRVGPMLKQLQKPGQVEGLSGLKSETTSILALKAMIRMHSTVLTICHIIEATRTGQTISSQKIYSAINSEYRNWHEMAKQERGYGIAHFYYGYFLGIRHSELPGVDSLYPAFDGIFKKSLGWSEHGQHPKLDTFHRVSRVETFEALDILLGDNRRAPCLRENQCCERKKFARLSHRIRDFLVEEWEVCFPSKIAKNFQFFEHHLIHGGRIRLLGAGYVQRPMAEALYGLTDPHTLLRVCQVEDEDERLRLLMKLTRACHKRYDWSHSPAAF